MTDDDTYETLKKTDGDIAGVDWEAEPPEKIIQEPEFQILHINNNFYAALADDEDNEKNEDDQENNNKSTGGENDGEITGVRHDDKSTGVDSNNESTGIKLESG